MEHIISFIAGFIYSGTFLIALLVTAILMLHSEGSSKLYILCNLMLGYFGCKYFALTGTETIIAAASYLPMGIAWSIISYKRKIGHIKSSLKEEAKTNQCSISFADKQERALESIKLSNNLENLALWTLTWLTGCMYYAFKDVISLVETVLRKYFIGIYKRIADHAAEEISSIKPAHNQRT